MKLVIIGSGKVASSMGRAFFQAGHTILQVAGRSAVPVRSLARRLKAKPVLIPSSVDPGADAYIIAVNDDAINEIMQWLGRRKGMVIHTSGSFPLSAIVPNGSPLGVMWPVDTISNNYTSFRNTPLCLETSSKSSKSKLQYLASTISDQIYFLDASQRTWLHLAAVFANNFTNHLNSIAFSILKNQELDHHILHKLIRSTSNNIIKAGPLKSQTGPAIRNDLSTINMHLEMLKQEKKMQELYRLLTNDIIGLHKSRSAKKK